MLSELGLFFVVLYVRLHSQILMCQQNEQPLNVLIVGASTDWLYLARVSTCMLLKRWGKGTT